jgi:CRISPR-associated protein Csm4
MKLYRIKLRPLSAWRTAWQSDTVAGLLCLMVSRFDGADTLREEILRECEAGHPPFVLSDAFPLDYLPVPEIARLSLKGESKKLKRAVLLTRESFLRSQRGEALSGEDLLSDEIICRTSHLHNTLDRRSDTTGAAGSLFSVTDFFAALPEEEFFLSIYARVRDDYLERLRELFGRLAQNGFGADISTGKGQFELISDLEDASWLDKLCNSDPVEERKGVVVLSTFQPAESDPVDGVWESFVKFGKVAPDFGDDQVFKPPMLMFRPGACFKTNSAKGFLGGMVTVSRVGTTEIKQLCYGLAVPHVWKEVV